MKDGGEKAYRIEITGMVQGIGFRPYIAECASRFGISGRVLNAGGIVHVYCRCSEEVRTSFLRYVTEHRPFGARIDGILTEPCDEELVGAEGFRIVASEVHGDEDASRQLPPLLPPDLATCPDCERELRDPGNRRFGHPFISCVACGPRYSILEELPYDRERITMKGFRMCRSCRTEYGREGDRRRHAQTIACCSCGPVMHFRSVSSRPDGTGKTGAPEAFGRSFGKPEDWLGRSVEHLRGGGILALKDIGGYHLACLPEREITVRALRRIKGREKKPFALMYPDPERIRQDAFLSPREEELLLSPARPIVLLNSRSPDMESGQYVGAMLPSNPAQILLAERMGPLIMTSANTSEEPMILSNDRMEQWLRRAAEQLAAEPGEERTVSLGMACHERPILTPLDDSIQAVRAGRTLTLRRGRGLVPEPVLLPENGSAGLPEQAGRQILAMGGDLKASFGYLAGDRFYASQHFGDLSSVEAMEEYLQQVDRMGKLFGFRPSLVACDMHPGYVSGGAAEEAAGRIGGSVRLLQIQHHHAHAASVMAEHGLQRALALTYDGTGYGTDGSVWGGEILLCEGAEVRRAGHLRPISMIAGDEGARNADLSLIAYLEAAGMDTAEAGSLAGKEQQAGIVRRALQSGSGQIRSSSMGRLFDALSALLDLCHYNHYEGEAPILLERCAVLAQGRRPELDMEVRREDETWILEGTSLVRGAAEAVRQGYGTGEIAEACIRAIAEASAGAVSKLIAPREMPVVLSGGSFQNKLLLERLIEELEAAGYEVYTNEKVPQGDGGIALGQAWVAGRRMSCV